MFSSPAGSPQHVDTPLEEARKALARARDEGDLGAEVMARCRIHQVHRAENASSEGWWAHV